MMVRIARSAHDAILNEAEHSPQSEVCGLLIGTGETIEVAVPAPNVAENQRRMFEIDPKTLLAEHRRARTQGHRILGHYHSHPGGRSTPSLRDAANALHDGAIWIIIGEGGAIGAFRAKENGEIAGRFDPVELEVIEG